MEPENVIDMPDIDNPGAHQYWFWFVFPGSDVLLGTTLSVPGHIPDAEADRLAREGWRAVVLHAANPDPGPQQPRKGFTRAAAMAAANGARFRVWRPGGRRDD